MQGKGRSKSKHPKRKTIYIVYIIYILYVCTKHETLEATVTYKKKIIDLKEDTFKSLSVMAARQGTNLKKLIENLLDLRHVSLSGAQRTGIRQEDGKEPAKERYITNNLLFYEF